MSFWTPVNRGFSFLSAPSLRSLLLTPLVVAGMHSAAGAPYILTNGVGDGALRVGVDGYGSFGSSVGEHASDAVYDPIGSEEEAGTVFQSGLYISGPAAWLTSGNIEGGNLPNPEITGTSTSATSTFTHGSIEVHLEQALIDSFNDDGDRVGTILDQRYIMRNLVEVPNSFSITRYVDGDLDFDDSISDGGGLLERAGNQILYETDAASGGAAATTFVGITAIGGSNADPTGRYEIDEYSTLLAKISSGGSLNNSIDRDDDGDGFIDSAYDVTLALRSFIELPAFGTTVFTTQTLFGNAVPPLPGSSEALPLLPSNDEPPFIFDIAVDDPDDIVWLDPDIAVAFDYSVAGGLLVDSIQLPSLATVPQTVDYEVLVLNGVDFVHQAYVSPGGTYDFPIDVSQFRIAGIDASLGIDPYDPLAFPLGLSFNGVGRASVTMTPVIVPEPTGFASVLLAGLAGVARVRLRRRPRSGP